MPWGQPLSRLEPASIERGVEILRPCDPAEQPQDCESRIEVEMVDTEVAKLAEEQFVSRFRENISESFRSATVRTSDCVDRLRDLTKGTLLRRELEAKYPLGKGVAAQIDAKPGLFGGRMEKVVLTGRVMLRLERFIEQDRDDQPLSLMELHRVLSEEADVATRNRCGSVLGLFSPVGWAEDASQFVKNDPPGSGWASGVVHPILIGPAVTDLTWDGKDATLRAYIQHFCGLTQDERRRVCRDEIQKAVVVQHFANLQKIAEARGFVLDFVEDVAKDLCQETADLRLATVRGVGPVVKRRM